MSTHSLDEFFAACGTIGPLRLTIDDGRGPADHVLPQPYALVGSDSRADIRLAGAVAPRRAAYLQALGGRLLCLDLAGLSGGRPEKHPPHQWLNPGETWSCGSISIRVDHNHSGLAGTSRPESFEEVRPASVEISGGSSGACRYRIKDQLVLIGKSAQCQVRLRDAAVSRFHCALIHTPAGLWALDLLGRSGIAVNGISARLGRLEDGDELKIGGFTFRPQFGPGWDLVPRQAVPAPAPIANPPVPAVAMPNALSASLGTEIPPLLTFFANLQQQMAEQFRLTMAGVVESFQRMHDDQMRLVFDEMAQIRRLTEELISLKSNPVPSPASVATPPPRIAWPPEPPAEDRPSVAGGKDNGPGIPRPRPIQSTSTERQPAVGEKPPIVPSQPKPDTETDVHAWVNRRVAEIQRERDGRWQKIFSFLTGATS